MGRVHVLAWQAAYRGIMPDEFLDSMSPDRVASSWRNAMAADPQPPGDRRLVAVWHGEVVGIALVSAERTDPDGEVGELVLINVEPRAWGQGVGMELLSGCCEALAELGYAEAVLWVARENARARRFYEREGWRPDGAKRVEVIAGATVVDARYRRCDLPRAASQSR